MVLLDECIGNENNGISDLWLSEDRKEEAGKEVEEIGLGEAKIDGHILWRCAGQKPNNGLHRYLLKYLHIRGRMMFSVNLINSQICGCISQITQQVVGILFFLLSANLLPLTFDLLIITISPYSSFPFSPTLRIQYSCKKTYIF